jgi:hypothetical protein
VAGPRREECSTSVVGYHNDAFVGGPTSELWPASVGGPKLKWAFMGILSWPFST